MKRLIQVVFKPINKHPAGFSLLELIVVIALAALLAGYAIPNFTALFTSPEDNEFRYLTKVLRMLRTDAILRSRSYCLIFNLKQQKIQPSLVELGQCRGNEEDWPKWLKEHEYPETIILHQARFASKTKEINPSEEFEVRIDSSGFVTPFVITFAEKEGSRLWEVESSNVLGQLIMREL